MSGMIEDYALIGDLHTAALVARDGSVDWLCLPRFDSKACFAALLGEDRHGHWRIAPAEAGCRVSRRYLPDTLILETEFGTSSGQVRLTDCMPPRSGDPVLVRMIEGISGSVDVRMTLGARFEYGSAQPRILRRDGAHCILAGSEMLWLFGPVQLRSRRGIAVAEFSVSEAEQVPLAAVWRSAPVTAPPAPFVPALLEEAERWWTRWVSGLDCGGEWRDAVTRSLITVKALTFAPTGGVVAAPTSSLPQQASGARNWDYRYCWLRDAAATLPVLLRSGALAEASALLRFITNASAGPPSQVQGLYGIDGRRWLPEIELDWLPGYEGAQPVRAGNAAAAQRQLAAFGEVMTARLAARMAGMPGTIDPWEHEEVLGFLEAGWRAPDPGNWEVRGLPRQFVYTKVMVWAAADAAVKMIERFGDAGPADRWRALRAQVRSDVLEQGYDASGETFVQHYAGTGVDASLLRLAQLGFLPPSDERMIGTVAAIARQLDRGGVMLRYQQDPAGSLDGLPAGAGCYLPATFWLAQCYALMGRGGEARRAFAGALELRNDVGLLPEEYDPLRRRFAGNFPLAVSHAAAAATAAALDSMDSPAGAARFTRAGRRARHPTWAP